MKKVLYYIVLLMTTIYIKLNYNKTSITCLVNYNIIKICMYFHK